MTAVNGLSALTPNHHNFDGNGNISGKRKRNHSRTSNGPSSEQLSPDLQDVNVAIRDIWTVLKS